MKYDTVTKIVPQFYRRTEESPWMAIPPMTHRSLASFLLFGVYAAIKYSDGSQSLR